MTVCRPCGLQTPQYLRVPAAILSRDTVYTLSESCHHCKAWLSNIKAVPTPMLNEEMFNLSHMMYYIHILDLVFWYYSGISFYYQSLLTSKYFKPKPFLYFYSSDLSLSNYSRLWSTFNLLNNNYTTRFVMLYFISFDN